MMSLGIFYILNLLISGLPSLITSELYFAKLLLLLATIAISIRASTRFIIFYSFFALITSAVFILLLSFAVINIFTSFWPIFFVFFLFLLFLNIFDVF